MPEYIYYTGIGARKNGKHTIKQFLDIMNKNYGVVCKLRSVARKSLKNPACKKADKIFTYELNNPNKIKYSKSEKEKKLLKFTKIMTKCETHKQKLMKKEPGCGLTEYLEYSGAEHKN
jgi:hypothetical protein